jgi:hypothetical protein
MGEHAGDVLHSGGEDVAHLKGVGGTGHGGQGQNTFDPPLSRWERETRRILDNICRKTREQPAWFGENRGGRARLEKRRLFGNSRANRRRRLNCFDA